MVTADGRAAVLQDGQLFDIGHASENRFGPTMGHVLDEWEEFCAWAENTKLTTVARQDGAVLNAPVPRPRQIFAIGLNYVDHAAESGFTPPIQPMVFAKFPSAVCGPDQDVVLPPGDVDWEAELVVVIGVGGYRIRRRDALNHVAGVTVGQDLSERSAQMRGEPPQFSLAKSHPGFAPTGPAMVTLDELPPLETLRIECRLNGEMVQSAMAADMVFSVPELISSISETVTLLPGDLIFTGTPSGVGMGCTPPRYIEVGDVLVSSITGLGEIVQTFVATEQDSRDCRGALATPLHEKAW